MDQAVTTNSQILGGIPVFSETRVPVESLFEYLKRGHTIDFFLEQFPSVSREQVQAVLEAAKQKSTA